MVNVFRYAIGNLCRVAILFAALLPAVASAASGAPTIAGVPPAVVVVGQPYSFRPTANDPGGSRLFFTLSNAPSWISFNYLTGQMSGKVPATLKAGTVYSGLVMTARSWKGRASLPAFSITVQGNGATATATAVFRLSGSPATSVAVGSAYSFAPALTTARAPPSATASRNKPVWASFSTSTGKLSGTPAATNVGSTGGIVISANNGAATASLPSFTLQVTGAAATANAAPTLTGTPSNAVLAGMDYSFRPVAADSNGDALTFAIQNKPAWATFDTATGALSGRPSAAQVGNYGNILIGVSDGKASVSLPAFGIAVTATANGTATLLWTPPTQMTSGAALTGLAGYRLYYGQDAGALTQTVQIANAGATAYTLTNLGSGTWYFAMTAYTSAGSESERTSVGSKSIP